MSEAVTNNAGGKQVTLECLATGRKIDFTVAFNPAAKVTIRLGAEEIHVSPFNLLVAAQLMQSAATKGN